MDATVENSFTFTTKTVDKDLQENVSNISEQANCVDEKEHLSRNIIENPSQLAENPTVESVESYAENVKADKSEDKNPEYPELIAKLTNSPEKCESEIIEVTEESERAEEEDIVIENEAITNISNEDTHKVINNEAQETESENGSTRKVKTSKIAQCFENALDNVSRDKPQDNGTTIDVLYQEIKHPQDPPPKVTRLRSGTWKSYAAILKRRSIKWLNKSRCQMMSQGNIYGRKIYKELMEEGRDGDSGKKFKIRVNKEEEDEDFEIENQSKRSRIDDDLEIVVSKKMGRMLEDEDYASKVKVFCDTTNGKKGFNDYDIDDEKKSTDVNTSSKSPKMVDIEVIGENSSTLRGKSSQNTSKKEREKSLQTNITPDDLNLSPTKKLCLELEMNFASHDKTLSEYIESTSNETVNDIQRHVEQLIVEIQTLNDMIRAKEMEWNNMIHLKKTKEEIVARLTRKRHVLEYASTKFGSSLDFDAFSADDMQKLADETKNMSESSMAKLTQVFLLNRANIGGNEQQKSTTNAPESRCVYQSKTCEDSQSISATGESGENRNSEGGFSASQASAFVSDLFNGHNTRLTQQMGRQGAIKDVKSIIADYRQRHPEIVPRRGRRMKSMLSENSCPKESGNSRPSSADSSHSNATNSNFASSSGPQTTSQSSATIGNLSFKDVLVQFAKLSQSDRKMISTATESATVNAISNSLGKPPPPYPEVTLYPVTSQSSDQVVLNSTNNTHSNSLLHGILTKSTTRPNASGFTSFSPTLARLLTAPERITSSQTAGGHFQQQINPALNLSKSHSEITITPVVSQTNFQQSLLQQQQHQRFDNCNSSSMPSVQIRMKQENIFNIDDEADDSADRLVIDEGNDRNIMESNATKDQQISMVGQEFHENEVPECQGCKKREAQFVCAGCGNQWYCSRECQVTAWDEHSEVCTG